jgi:hypothetical protein
METPRETERGEHWPDEGIYMSFNVKKIWKWILSFFLLVSVAQAQVSYCGVDVAKDLVPNGGVAKQTLSNLAIYSEDLSNAIWANTIGGVAGAPVVTANYALAPDGTMTADRLQLTLNGGVTSSDIARKNQSIAGLTNGLIYRSCFWVRSTDGVSTYRMHHLTNSGTTTGFDVTPNYVRTCIDSLVSATTGTITIGLRGAQTPANSNTADILIWGASFNRYSDPPDYLQSVASATTLGPTCPLGYSQSLTDPSRCFLVSPITSRTIRTW